MHNDTMHNETTKLLFAAIRRTTMHHVYMGVTDALTNEMTGGVLPMYPTAGLEYSLAERTEAEAEAEAEAMALIGADAVRADAAEFVKVLLAEIRSAIKTAAEAGAEAAAEAAAE
jgi:hypothetical protein